MPKTSKARAVGLNHIALEVGDIEEALAFYGRLFEFKLRGKSEHAAFIDLGANIFFSGFLAAGTSPRGTRPA